MPSIFLNFTYKKKLPTLCVHIICNHFNKFTTPTSRNFFIAKMLIYSSFFNIHICFIFLSVMSFLTISKLMMFLCLKCRSVFSKNSSHLLLLYHVSSPSFSNNFKSLGTNGGTKFLSNFQVISDLAIILLFY